MTTRSRRPDIIFVVLDTLRADRLSCYGYGSETTPHLDALAAQGVLFERAISPAQWTIPAHASLFTGEFPSTHGTTQIFDRHTHAVPTFAELLGRSGYHTVGFCNNPLLGVVQNDLDRGFREFYNYGGVLPNRPPLSGRRPHLPRRFADWARRQLYQLADPIQQLFTRNEALLGLALHPWLVPLWERNINFRGNTRLSILDVVGYLKRHHQRDDPEPLLVYLNLMETHLPFSTPVAFSRKFAPTFHQHREARAFMQSLNHRTYDWITPIVEPFTAMQHQVLNEMYDAEVAYEDHQLRHLLTYLDEPEVRDNALVIVASDHGEGLDHHGYIGHPLVVYEDLVRVPLIVRYPAHYAAGQRVAAPVSTRRIFHTVLDAAGFGPPSGGEPSDGVPAGGGPPGGVPLGGVDLEAVERLSLRRALNGHDTDAGGAFAEAYPPLTLVHLIEKRRPQIAEQFRCRAVRRTLYDGDRKLIRVDDAAEELYDVTADPDELTNRIAEQPAVAMRIAEQLDAAVATSLARRPLQAEPPSHIDVERDRQLRERLRRLGYID